MFVDTVKKEVGLNLGVLTMCAGERSLFFIDPDYGYGKEGNFSFPNVPKN